MKKSKKFAVIPLLMGTMIMCVACASKEVVEHEETTSQVEENVEQTQTGNAQIDTAQAENSVADNAQDVQNQTDPRFVVDEWVNVLGSIVHAKDDLYR